ncbi:rhodanese-like domain-containing protein [Rummeliibacillus suwonensis]|jgi:rhodanese-related sulfurtransferase|uniref:rhodanese-like domain-containing protein n=1 Tax=Rummeliibacillus suwonensis TaxID=1306154 RepID=UPI0011B45215|nr:rhodanese-like domain-containing protein [Rummeliibacillus suwonensis]MBO2536053.1 rhodanese-like domain-containing protein [Rummeliibacillus suwonensis]
MKIITPEEVLKKIDEGQELHLIDVREPEEIATGKIGIAQTIPLGTLEFHLDELDKNLEYIMVCRSGRRSAQATSFLEENGYKAANMEGGMLAWEGPVE